MLPKSFTSPSPSLIKYLQRLEQTVGGTLIDRQHSPLRLTCIGEHFYDYVQHIRLQEFALQTKINEINNMGRDCITIGMALWRANVLLPEFLPLFLQKHPLIQINLKEGSATFLENSILEDDLDFCIMNLPFNYGGISFEPIAEEHIFLVGSKRNVLVQELLAEAGDMDCEFFHTDICRFKSEPFILTQPGQHITQFVNEMLGRNNLELNCILRTLNVSTAVNMAAANMGFSFVPELGTHSKAFPKDDVVLFTVNEPVLSCTLAIAYKKSKYLSKASQLFISELKEFISRSSYAGLRET